LRAEGCLLLLLQLGLRHNLLLLLLLVWHGFQLVYSEAGHKHHHSGGSQQQHGSDAV
jgi:hypothetical protein